MKASNNLENQDNTMRYDQYVTSLDELSTHALPPEEDGPFRESKTPDCAKVIYHGQLGPGAAAWIRARPMDTSRVIVLRSSRTHSWDIWGSKRTWRRRVPLVVQRTPTSDMRVCVIALARM